MEFCMATLLINRQAGLKHFTDEVVNRPDIQEMIKRVEFRAHPDADAAGFHTMRSYVDVYLKDGRHLSAQADYAKGSPQVPVSEEEVVQKLAECLEWGGREPGKASELAERVFALENEGSLDAIVQTISGGAT
jgi:2-methylcitrate dehydratase PrpD